MEYFDSPGGNSLSYGGIDEYKSAQGLCIIMRLIMKK